MRLDCLKTKWQRISAPYVTGDVDLRIDGTFVVAGQVTFDQASELRDCRSGSFRRIDKRPGEGEHLELRSGWFSVERYHYVNGEWLVAV